MTRNLNPALIILNGHPEVAADCPTCGARVYGTDKRREMPRVPLTEDGRIDLSAFEFICAHCYPETAVTFERTTPSGVLRGTRRVPHPDAKPFTIGA